MMKKTALYEKIIIDAKKITPNPDFNTFFYVMINILNNIRSLKSKATEQTDIEDFIGFEELMEQVDFDNSLNHKDILLGKNSPSKYIDIDTILGDELTGYRLLRFILENPTEEIKANYCKTKITTDADFNQFLDDFLASTSTTNEESDSKVTKMYDWLSTYNNKKAEVIDDSIDSILDKTIKLEQELRSAIFGQEIAIYKLVRGIYKAEVDAITTNNRTTPRAVFLFAGPPGVGKTYMASLTAKFLGIPFKRFDMSGYGSGESGIANFCGINASYKNAKVGEVTGFVNSNPRSFILFDEIDKSSLSVMNLFLQILDQGNLKDEFSNEDISFKDTIIVMTTNQGSSLYDDNTLSNLSNLPNKTIIDALRNAKNPETQGPYFSSALCSRFAAAEVIMFNHLEIHHLQAIVKHDIESLINDFKNVHHLDINCDSRLPLLMLFSEGGLTDARVIKGKAKQRLNEELLELFRLYKSLNSKSVKDNLTAIDINISNQKDIEFLSSITNQTRKSSVFIFTDKKLDIAYNDQYEVVIEDDYDHALKILSTNEFTLALVDISCGYNKKSSYANLEDIDSDGVRLINCLFDTMIDLPVYLLETPSLPIDETTKLSFLRIGIRDKIKYDVDKYDQFANSLSLMINELQLQLAAYKLSASNQVVSFQTAQVITEDKGIIDLYNFKVKRSVGGEDGSHHVLRDIEKPKLKFSDIIGARDAKQELDYFIKYLKNPREFLIKGFRAPRGILLYGPPGTGKTSLAKAMAGESDVAFIETTASQFHKSLVGQGSESIRELFKTARRYAPAIIFIDEIDAIGKNRSNVGMEHVANVLNTLLTEMDGFKFDPRRPVFVLAATNMQIDTDGHKSEIDPALLRRFDRKIIVELPTKDERAEYLKIQVEKYKLNISSDMINNIASRSINCSLADLEHVINLAIRTAIRTSAEVNDEVLSDSFEMQIYGERRKWDSRQLRQTAVHEAGHAIISYLEGNIPSYLTIVARGNVGGYMKADFDDNKSVYTKDELLGRIRTSLAGRAAEIVYYGEDAGVTSGASSDIENATEIAKHLICRLGMSDTIGLAYIDSKMMESESISKLVFTEITKILFDQLTNTKQIIEANRKKIDDLVEALMKKDRLNQKEIIALLE